MFGSPPVEIGPPVDISPPVDLCQASWIVPWGEGEQDCSAGDMGWLCSHIHRAGCDHEGPAAIIIPNPLNRCLENGKTCTIHLDQAPHLMGDIVRLNISQFFRRHYNCNKEQTKTQWNFTKRCNRESRQLTYNLGCRFLTSNKEVAVCSLTSCV